MNEVTDSNVHFRHRISHLALLVCINGDLCVCRSISQHRFRRSTTILIPTRGGKELPVPTRLQIPPGTPMFTPKSEKLQKARSRLSRRRFLLMRGFVENSRQESTDRLRSIEECVLHQTSSNVLNFARFCKRQGSVHEESRKKKEKGRKNFSENMKFQHH